MALHAVIITCKIVIIYLFRPNDSFIGHADISYSSSQGVVKSDSKDTLNRDTICRLEINIISMLGLHEYTIVHFEKSTVGTL